MLEPTTITYQGMTRTVWQWAKTVKISYNTLLGRIQRGWPAEEAIETPPRHRGGGRRTHGCSNTKEYSAWRRMIFRCENRKYPWYHRYGGRGSVLCHE